MTTIREIVNDSDLTTDACPHPPRDEEKVIIDEPGNPDKPPNVNVQHTSIPKTRRVNKSKTNSSPIANIINIANCNNVQIGKKITYKLTAPTNVNGKEKSDIKTNKERNFVKTEIVNKYLSSNEPLTTKHIGYVSSHAKERWRDTARLLEYSDGQIYQFHENHYIRGVKEVIYNILLDYIQNKAEEATIGKLMTALWDTEQEEVVLMFSEKFKI